MDYYMNLDTRIIPDTMIDSSGIPMESIDDIYLSILILLL